MIQQILERNKVKWSSLYQTTKGWHLNDEIPQR